MSAVDAKIQRLGRKIARIFKVCKSLIYN